MNNNNNSPFSSELLSSNPTQEKMAQAESQLKVTQKKQQIKSKKATKKSQQDALIIAKGKPFWWMLTLFICSVVYLFPEAIFNAALVDVAGGKNATEDELHAVELFGRTISGIGVTLLLADLLLKGRFLTSAPRALGSFCVLAILVWPTVFFGQKWLVDQFIINPSSPAERQQAYLSQVLRSALIEKSIEFEGINYNPELPHSSVEKTFLSVFGGLVYADDTLVAELEQKKRSIMEKFVRDRAMSGFDENYQRYADFRQDLQRTYTDYLSGSKRYNDGVNSADSRADEYWVDTQNQVSQGWQQYQQGVTAYEARVEARAQKLAPKLYDFFERRNKCGEMKKGSRRDNCYERLQNNYDSELEKYSMPYIPPNEWLIREEITTAENVGNSIISGVMTFGLFTAMQAIDAATGGDAGIKDHRMVYTSDVNHYKQILMVKMEGDFIKDSGGYPLGIEDIHQFRHHEITSQKVSVKLKPKGLTLPNDWRMADRNGFNNAVAKKVKQEADQRWRNETAKRGFNAPPNLTWNEFQRHKQTQQRIKSEMAELYVSPMLADWNNKQFLRQVIEPNIQRKTSELLTILEAQKAEFADGGTFEESGKSALRATIVPPISMAISLALVLLTVLKLPLKAAELIKARNPASTTKKSPKQTIISMGVSGGLMASIFVLPMTFSSNEFTLEDSATQYFFEQMEQNDAASVSYALRWLLTTQPIVQPIGATLDEVLKVSKGFEAISAPFHHMDAAIMGKLSPSNSAPTSTSKQATASKLPLTIHSNIQGAKISVMNIKPKYAAGMKLPAGNYDIKVSAPGYQTVRKWVTLNENNTEFSINLTRQ
ncbi:PEGA domain-containing protein [Shewanella gaetbuli]|uniref:PEGA domain-containing protein n=1 Tax=Shewanella gaetbuli TaxID=220752 RepID=A0A9X1ZM83_9GAMM|nr:PEGA domain-containing protein [Shewanella gaetbuli]MCL1142357.1 PEGA domain-containing protein [Shewanella gaetbuli]